MGKITIFGMCFLWMALLVIGIILTIMSFRNETDSKTYSVVKEVGSYVAFTAALVMGLFMLVIFG